MKKPKKEMPIEKEIARLRKMGLNPRTIETPFGMLIISNYSPNPHECIDGGHHRFEPHGTDLQKDFGFEKCAKCGLTHSHTIPVPAMSAHANRDALALARSFIEKIVSYNGPYTYLNGTAIVQDAYAVLRKIGNVP